MNYAIDAHLKSCNFFSVTLVLVTLDEPCRTWNWMACRKEGSYVREKRGPPQVIETNIAVSLEYKLGSQLH